MSNPRPVIDETVQPILTIENRHSADCGRPPHIQVSADEYCSYLENRHGEQWIFLYNRKTKEATVRGGDVGWDQILTVKAYRKEVVIVDGRNGSVIVNDEEHEWLRTCVRSSGCKPALWKPHRLEAAGWEVMQGQRYFSLTPHNSLTPAIRVFVSSPADLVPERRLIAKICTKLESIFQVPILPLLWEGCQLPQRYIPPFPSPHFGMGGQGNIDHHLWQRSLVYDVYVGMVWKRLGTPTGAYRSGTEAELQNAVVHQRTAGKPTAILLYHKLTSDVPPDVVDFVQDVRPHTLLHQFKNLRELERMVRSHLVEEITRILGSDSFWKEVDKIRQRRIGLSARGSANGGENE